MKSNLKITFLGSGSALGVPQIGCHCSVCKSIDPMNLRTRTAMLIESGGKTFLLDPGPDIRFQLLKTPVKKLDGIIITHPHHDHIGGFDDLRVFAIRQETVIPVLIHEKNLYELKNRCGYLFKPGYTHFTVTTLSDDLGHEDFLGFKFRYFNYVQNLMTVTGFISNEVAFVSDIQNLDDDLIDNLRDLDTLIVSCILKAQSPFKSHLTFKEIEDLKARTGAKNIILTHLGHDIDYYELSKMISDDMMVSYDGFVYEA